MLSLRRRTVATDIINW